MTPGDPVVGGTVLRRAAIQSPNFVQTPLTGWAINADGSAYFANVTAQGNISATTFTGTTITGVTISGSVFQGTDWLINASGEFFYSGTPAAGNLILSNAQASGTDAFGNHYVQGAGVYASGFAASLNAGFVNFYTGSLASGWSASATIETDSSGDLFLLAKTGRSVSTTNNTLDDGSGNAAISGTLTVNGSGNTGNAGLPDGTIHGGSDGPTGTGFFNTQGLASGSYGSTHQHTLPNFPTATHTHGPGSFAVGNGVHDHVL